MIDGRIILQSDTTSCLMQPTLITELVPVSETKQKTPCGKITVICTEAIKVNIEAISRKKKPTR